MRRKYLVTLIIGVPALLIFYAISLNAFLTADYGIGVAALGPALSGSYVLGVVAYRAGKESVR